MLIVVSALFTAAGLWMTARGGEGRRLGVGAAAFFGSCLLVAIVIPWRKATTLRNLAARSVEIVGSVPIRIRVGRFVALASGAAAVLLTTAWAFQGSIASWGSLAAAILLLALVPSVALGPPGRRAIVFEPGGLRMIEPRFDVLVPWDDIVAARLLDVEGTLLVGIDVRDPARLAPRIADAASSTVPALRRLARHVARNRALLDCDLCIGASALGLDAALLLRAIETYVRMPEARCSLAPRPPLPPARGASR
jgi:hypothetical protein